MSDQISYSAADYGVAAVILVIPVAIGILYAVKDVNRATRAEYLLGGRKMSIGPVAMSMFITYVSAISLMGMPMEIFYFGGIAVNMYIGFVISYIFGYFTVLPLMYPLHLTSVYEYLKLRYRSEAVRLVGTIIGMSKTLFYQAIVLLSPALALQACADLPLWMSIALLGAIGTLYTAIGGFKSVIWTDVFQGLVVFTGAVMIVVKACIEVGGLGEVFRLSEDGGRLKFDKFSLDPRVRHTQWSLIVGFCFMWMSNLTSQSTVQRISSVKSLRDAKIAFLLNIPCHVIYGSIMFLTGVSIYAYYVRQRCDPYEGGLISNRNQLAPYFVLQAMSDQPGLAGVFLGALCCASLSSLSSGINAMAANTVEDILPLFLRSSSESLITFITKLFVIAYGCLTIGLAYLAQSVDGPIIQLASAVFGAFGSPLLGIILLGASVPWANKFGALAGIAASLTLTLWISFGSVLQGTPLKPLAPITTENCFGPAEIRSKNSSSFSLLVKNQTSTSSYYGGDFTVYSHHSTTENSSAVDYSDSSDTFFLYDISYEWYTLIGCTVCILTGLLVSYLTNPKSDNASHQNVDRRSTYTEARYIFPFLRSFWGLDDQQQFDKTNGDVKDAEELERHENTNEKNGHLEMENLYPLLHQKRSSKNCTKA